MTSQNTPPRLSTRPPITDVAELDDNTPDNAVISIEVCAALTGYSSQTLKTMRHRKLDGPPSFVLNHRVRYQLGAVRQWMAEQYETTLVAGE